MKTTLNISDALIYSAKAFAAQQHTTLTRLIEEGLQLRLRMTHKGQSIQKKRRTALPVYAGRGGLVAKLNPLSNQALLDAADS